MNRPVTAPTPVDYPCSDGQPMAESDFQLEPLVYAITALRTHFHHRKKVYVAGDMFLYHEEGQSPMLRKNVGGSDRHSQIRGRGNRCTSVMSYNALFPRQSPLALSDFVRSPASRSTSAQPLLFRRSHQSIRPAPKCTLHKLGVVRRDWLEATARADSKYLSGLFALAESVSGLHGGEVDVEPLPTHRSRSSGRQVAEPCTAKRCGLDPCGFDDVVVPSLLVPRDRGERGGSASGPDCPRWRCALDAEHEQVDRGRRRPAIGTSVQCSNREPKRLSICSGVESTQ